MQADSLIRLLGDTRLVFTVSIILVASLAYQSALLIWNLVPEPELQPFEVMPVQIDQSNPSTQPSQQQKIQQISQANLFGQVVKQAVVQETVSEAPTSNLNYKVRGIYYSEDESLASAILEKSPNDTQFYRLGDEIDNQIFVAQIQPEYILISRRGRMEKLLLEQPLADLNPGDNSNLVQNRSDPSHVRLLQSYKRRYSNNPLALAKRFQAIPVQQNGRNIGYKLKALRGETLLKRLGLQRDDVFVEINGIGLDKPFEALDALKSLTTAEDVSLTVIRNGNRETLGFSLKQ